MTDALPSSVPSADAPPAYTLHDHAVEQAILDLVTARGAGKTICPSEVARGLLPAGAPDGQWRALMPQVRRAAARLKAQRRVVVTQRGQPVDPMLSGGPIRLGQGPDLVGPREGTPRDGPRRERAPREGIVAVERNPDDRSD